MEPEIRPIPSEDIGIDKRFLKLKHSDVLMKPPFVCAIIGGAGSGKTSFGYTALNDLYAKYYDEVVVISGTYEGQEHWENVNQKNVVFLKSFNDEAYKEYLEGIVEENEKRKKKGKYPMRIALCMDDIIFEGINKNKRGFIDDLFVTSRHYYLCIFIMLQESKQISPIMRKQINYNIIFRVTAEDLENLSKQHSNLLTDKQFKEMYNDIQRKGNHEFLIVDYKSPMDTRFRHRFYTIIDQEKYKH